MEQENLLSPQELQELGLDPSIRDFRADFGARVHRACSKVSEAGKWAGKAVSKGLDMTRDIAEEIVWKARLYKSRAAVAALFATAPLAGCNFKADTSGLQFCKPDPNNPMQCYVEPDPDTDIIGWDSIGADGSGEIDDPDIQEGIDEDTGEDMKDTKDTHDIKDTFDAIEDTFDQLDQLDQEGLIDIEDWDVEGILDLIPDETSEDTGEDTQDTGPDIPVDPCLGVVCAPPTQCGVEACVEGLCVKGDLTGEECDDEDPCSEQDECNEDEECKGTPKDCSNDNLCDENEACNPASGECESDEVNPDDGNLCTVDTCVPDTGVANTPKDIDNGNPCDVEACDPATGVVSHTPIECESTAPCGESSSDQNTGDCVETPNDTLCEDENPCTDDECDLDLGGCAYFYNSNPCSIDADLCVLDAMCDAGVCEPVEWTDSDDGNTCTTDGCDPLTGEPSNEPNVGANCDDENKCTLSDICSENGDCEGIYEDDGYFWNTTTKCWEPTGEQIPHFMVSNQIALSLDTAGESLNSFDVGIWHDGEFVSETCAQAGVFAFVLDQPGTYFVNLTKNQSTTWSIHAKLMTQNGGTQVVFAKYENCAELENQSLSDIVAQIIGDTPEFIHSAHFLTEPEDQGECVTFQVVVE